MSKPVPSFFYDTSALIALFNVHTSEAAVAQKIHDYVQSTKHASRHIADPNLVELFYKVRAGENKMSPNETLQNLVSCGVSRYAVTSVQQRQIFEDYCTFTVKGGFDYADYFMCRAAMEFPNAVILTTDNRDLPLALAEASKRHTELTGKTPNVSPLPFS